MAIPSRTQVLNTFTSSVAEHRRPDLVDNFFNSASLTVALRAKNKVPVKGGEVIKVPHIYTNFSASSYGRGDEFSTTVVEFATQMTFDWKFVYAPVNLDVIDVELNDAPERSFDLVDAALEVGELSLVNDFSTQLYADGTGNGSKDIAGLAIAVSRTGTYGGIARGTDAQGASIRAAVEDATGGTLSLAAVNTQFGVCVIARKKPDIISTTQTLHDRMWERSQPSEQNKGGEAWRAIGFTSGVRFNGADVIVDAGVPSGLLYFLNSEFWELMTHVKWDFRFRGFMEPANQQRQVGQLIWWGSLVCRGPRFQGVMSGLS